MTHASIKSRTWKKTRIQRAQPNTDKEKRGKVRKGVDPLCM